LVQFFFSPKETNMACRFLPANSALLRTVMLHKTVFKNKVDNIRQTLISNASSRPKPRERDYPYPVLTNRKMASELDSLKTRGFLRAWKEYNPPPDVSQQIIRICTDLLNLKETRDIKDVALTDRSLRFKILSKCINQLDHDIPNSQLHKINTIGHLVSYFNEPVKTTTSMEELKHSTDLPPNLHIQHEYIRFHPETDTMFGGLSAFPGRSTIVTGLKARKKYKGFKVKTSVYDQM